ncbi:MAG: DNA polymerase III subunit gamma/tau [Oscillospiraceae bacterium]|nr:DNA polymerase III subunit gamma/tau [Oscillospiraceae bacterium]
MLSLYRKYRPQTFSEVAGQYYISDTLRRQVADGKTSHAYLFVGTRGTGKTSCAKILARAINCENPAGGEPCNECESCRSILSGSATDVTEMDAASNNRVDDVRQLLSESVFLPTRLKKRVYIIDEVHMMTGSAFNALLKTLEEPPEHLVFILATTELRKIPATITSRCQIYPFARLSDEVIAERLREVAEKESLELTDPAAAVIARLSDGAMRDALSILDQAASISPITDDAVRQLVGLPSAGSLTELLSAVARRELAPAIEILTRVYTSGSDISSVFDELLGILRDLFVYEKSGQTQLCTSGASVRELDGLKSLIPEDRCLYLLSQISETRGKFTKSHYDKVIAEILLSRLVSESAVSGGGEAALLSRLSDIETRVQKAVSAAPVQTAPPRDTAAPAPLRDATPFDVTGGGSSFSAAGSPPYDDSERPPYDDEDRPPLDDADMPPFDMPQRQAAPAPRPAAKTAPAPEVRPRETPVQRAAAPVAENSELKTNILALLERGVAQPLSNAVFANEGGALILYSENAFLENIFKQNAEAVRAAAEKVLGASSAVLFRKEKRTAVAETPVAAAQNVDFQQTPPARDESGNDGEFGNLFDFGDILTVEE